MITKIGITAGTIWEFLDSNGVVELSRLSSSLDFSRDLIIMSLGWLTREGHVILQKDKKKYKVYLRRSERHPQNTKCPDLREGKQNICLANGDGLMIPSTYELENFCFSGHYENCPLRQKRNP